MKKTLKSALGRVMFQSGLHRPLLRNTAVITAFHRIDDQDSLDAITITPGQFEAFCAHARKHFHVVSLTGLLARLREGRDISNHMVITFDDGYEDNYLTAATVLKRHDLPATFFIATDMIGSRTQPYWDRDNDVQTRWMSWDQVKELHRMGFEIGAHTRTHADVAGLSLSEAEAEIRGSKTALEQALDTEITLFSYPFGGRHQCTDDVRKLVADMGFICCLSCHGGLVRPGDDPYRLLRTPVNRWYADYWHLGAEIVNDSRLRA